MGPRMSEHYLRLHNVLLAIVTVIGFIVPSFSCAATTVIDFDPPSFSSGQVVGTVGGVTFDGSPIVFTPTNIPTYTFPNALRSAAPCNDFLCSGGGNQLTMRFEQSVSMVSLRAGSDESTVQYCFPEQD